jgi:hypothetical protein
MGVVLFQEEAIPKLEITQQSTTIVTATRRDGAIVGPIIFATSNFICRKAKPQQTSSSHDSHDFTSNKMPPTLQNSSTINH